MHITIFRRRFTPWGVDGTMVIDGFFFCGTVENILRNSCLQVVT